jgi:hypothetical protein
VAYKYPDYFVALRHHSILYAPQTMLRAVMTDWFADYYHTFLLGLLGVAVEFSVLLPGQWLLLVTRLRSARRLAGRIWHGTCTSQGHSL